MPSARSIIVTILGVGLLATGARADGPSPFVMPKTWTEWRARRFEFAISSYLDLGALATAAKDAKPEIDRTELRDGLRLEWFHVRSAAGKSLPGLYVGPAGATVKARVPGILYLADGPDAALRPGLDGLAPAIELARRGMAVVWIEADPPAGPDDPLLWPERLFDAELGHEVLSHRPEVDHGRTGVIGVGSGGLRAAWQLAMDDDIKVGVAIGGMTRLDDRIKLHPDRPVAPWMAKLAAGKDTEALVALCAGRSLEWFVGDRDPSSPVAGVDVVERVGKAMDRLAEGEHGGFHVTRLGRQDEHYGRLQWMSALEIFDKAFFPQGPAPLGHAPEPEPAVTADFLDLAAHGLAGWVPEMSQRPGSWTWADGVISCKPGPDEYGWLRAPIEVDDFILSVEWKVRAGGNSGIFLRAAAVPWTFPPSASYKRVVGTLGLDWPSRTGLELQAQDDPGSANKFSSGSLYRHAAPAANPTHPPGRWNKYTVRARGPRVEIWSNGRQVLDARLDLHPLTLPNPPLRGYIGLQNHGAPAEFRNVKLLRLNK